MLKWIVHFDICQNDIIKNLQGKIILRNLIENQKCIGSCYFDFYILFIWHFGCNTIFDILSDFIHFNIFVIRFSFGDVGMFWWKIGYRKMDPRVNGSTDSWAMEPYIDIFTQFTFPFSPPSPGIILLLFSSSSSFFSFCQPFGELGHGIQQSRCRPASLITLGTSSPTFHLLY